MPSVLLIHGGLWEDAGADWFWRRTGVIDGLAARGFTVIAPDRLRRAPSWTAEASHIASAADLADESVTVVGGSFGCAVPPNALHPRSAVDALLRLLPSAVELPGCPEPPRPGFAAHLESLVDTLAAFARE